MRKLLTVVPFAALLAACATNAPTTPTATTNTTPQSAAQSFTCNDGGVVMASYPNNGQAANLNVSLPKVGLTNKNIALTQAVSGSGTRYVNDADPNMRYEWHTKADYGIMAVHLANNQEYSVNCHL